jgi:CheY-like chemotaxis protein
MDMSDDLWATYIDDGDLEDALLNLTINAMHAMSDEGALTISTQNEILDAIDAKVLGLEAGDYVCLSVADTGRGMDEETIEHIFDPFFSTKGDMGTGLGLSQVYGFVQRSGGGIRVSSEIGVGTQFSLYFPRYFVKESYNQENESDTKNSYRGNETILVVDDEDALRGLTDEVLSMNGYRVLQAQDAEQALKILQESPVDLMISDVIMPGMNGYQLAHIVMQKYPNTKIQMVSGFNSVENSIDVIEKLKNKQLYKPFNANELLRHVRLLLDLEKAEVS